MLGYNGAGMTNAPLLCLPGFMGTGADFTLLRSHLNQATVLNDWQWPDPMNDQTIADYAARCWQQIAARLPDQFTLYAYSLGGRVALHWLAYPEFQQRCRGVFIASAHSGLTDENARAERRAADADWANRFASEPLQITLNDWYQQPVFSSLSAEQKQQQIHAKRQQNPQQLARLLVTTSLGNQQDLTHNLTLCSPLTYLVGEQDTKFLTLSQRFCDSINRHIVMGAGHIAHAEQPQQVANLVAKAFNTGDQTA